MIKKVSTVKDGVERVAAEIFEKSGAVSASALVAKATPKSSPAHAGFTWDNDKAGHEYRLIEARQWLRVVVIKEERLVHVPARVLVVHGEKGEEGVYKPISAIQDNPDEFQRALAEATTRLASARNAVEELQSIAEKDSTPDRVAMVAQISRGLDILQQAIGSVH